MGYSPVYSQQLIVYTAETPNTEFEVPAGQTAVVRQVSGYQDIGGYVFRMYIQDSLEAPPCVVYAANDVGVAASFATEGRWVVPPGGIVAIFISSLGDTPCFYVGGYLLQNVLD